MRASLYQLQVALCLATLTPMTLAAADAENEASSAEPPACKYCPEDTGTSGWVEGGVGYQNNDDYHFGRYSGYDEEGGVFNASGELRYRSEEGTFLDGSAEDLGIDSRRIRVQGGRQGKYEVGIEYDKIPNYRERSAFSPFRELGDGRYGLPPGWVSGPTTADMPTLENDLERVLLKTERERSGANFVLYPQRKWEVTGYVRHEEKEGVKDMGATIGFNQTVYLPVSFGYQTDDFGLTLEYSGEKFQSQFSYTGSLFKNDETEITWRNPYQDETSSTGWGRLAEAPDNQFHQFSALLGYQLSDKTRLNAKLARGRMTQNEDFLSYTINSSIATTALPADSLDGEVNTTLASVEISSRPLPKLRVDASYTYSDRDNKSSVNVYDYVVTDLAGSPGERQNRPYSFEQHLLRLKGAYRLPKDMNLSVGYDDDKMDRTYVQAEETRDKTLWTKLKMRPLDSLEASLKYAYSKRDVSSYIALSDIDPLLDNPNPNYYDNPLMRVLTMADRQRDKIGFELSLTPIETLSLGIDVDYVKDEYDSKYLGLQEAKGLIYTASLSYTLSESLATSLYYTYDNLESDQKGSEKLLYTDPENLWIASSQNRTDTVGLGITWSAIPEKLDFGADLTYSEFTGEIGFDNSPALADIGSKLTSFNLHGNYRLSETLTLRAEYLYEKYKEDDWTKDGVVNTLSTLLSLGTAPQDNETYLGFVSLRYEF